MDTLKESTFGQVVRYATNGRIFSNGSILEVYGELLHTEKLDKQQDCETQGDDEDVESAQLEAEAVLDRPLTKTDHGVTLVGWTSDRM